MTARPDLQQFDIPYDDEKIKAAVRFGEDGRINRLYLFPWHSEALLKTGYAQARPDTCLNFDVATAMGALFCSLSDFTFGFHSSALAGLLSSSGATYDNLVRRLTKVLFNKKKVPNPEPRKRNLIWQELSKLMGVERDTEGMWMCPQLDCDRIFHKPSQLVEHVMSGCSGSPHRNNWQELLELMDAQRDTEGKWICPQLDCDKVFGDPVRLVDHVMGGCPIRKDWLNMALEMGAQRDEDGKFPCRKGCTQVSPCAKWWIRHDGLCTGGIGWEGTGRAHGRGEG